MNQVHAFQELQTCGRQTVSLQQSWAVLDSVCLWVELTVVGDARAAEIEFNELSAAQQTSPHYRVSHLGAGQPQHLQNRMISG